MRARGVGCYVVPLFILWSTFAGYSNCDTIGPVFTEEPRDTHVLARGPPAVVTCKARGALSLTVSCVPPVTHTSPIPQDFVEPENGVRHSELYLEVTREDVPPQGQVSCVCEAWSSLGSVRSRNATVKLAYLKKNFVLQPSKSFVPLNGALTLPCRPPDAEPPAQVFWLKDGALLQEGEGRPYVVTSAGNLIFQRVTLNDQGMYVCGAKNIVGSRQSDPAPLTVYVDGGWTEWSPWSSCSATCGRGQKVRSRLCANPAPLNGGSPCQGKDIQHIPCNQICTPVNGQWSEWSEWSACGPDSLHHRRRTCDNPPPTFGGLDCLGPDISTDNCTLVISLKDPPLPKALADAMIISAIVLAVIVTVVSVFCFSRRLKTGRGHDAELAARIKYDEKSPSEAYEPLLQSAWRLKAVAPLSGSRIPFPETGVYLTVPPGCFRSSQNLYMCLNFSDNKKPFDGCIEDGEVLLTPFVEVGPPDAVSFKSLIITMDHCIAGNKDDFFFTVIGNMNATSAAECKRLIQVGHETLDTPIFCQVDPDRIHLMVEAPGRYGLTGRPNGNNPMGCCLRLAIYSFLSSCRTHLRVYHVPDVLANTKEIKRREKAQGGVELHSPTSFEYMFHPEKFKAYLRVYNVQPASWHVPTSTIEIFQSTLWNQHLPFTTVPLDPNFPEGTARTRFKAHLLVFQTVSVTNEVKITLSGTIS